MVMQLPEGDQTSMSRRQMLARLDVCMGGRVGMYFYYFLIVWFDFISKAEELFFGSENVTSGASSDIQQATKLAKAMVTKWGLSDKVGIVFFDDKCRFISSLNLFSSFIFLLP
jgi:ATP-dependent metalloprotease